MPMSKANICYLLYVQRPDSWWIQQMSVKSTPCCMIPCIPWFTVSMFLVPLSVHGAHSTHQFSPFLVNTQTTSTSILCILVNFAMLWKRVVLSTYPKALLQPDLKKDWLRVILIEREIRNNALWAPFTRTESTSGWSTPPSGTSLSFRSVRFASLVILKLTTRTFPNLVPAMGHRIAEWFAFWRWPSLDLPPFLPRWNGKRWFAYTFAFWVFCLSWSLVMVMTLHLGSWIAASVLCEYPRDDAKWNYDMIKIIQLGNKSDIDGHATVDELIQALWVRVFLV